MGVVSTMSVAFTNVSVSYARENCYKQFIDKTYVVRNDGSMYVEDPSMVEGGVKTCDEFDTAAKKMLSPVVMIDSGNNMYAAVCKDGTLWTWISGLELQKKFKKSVEYRMHNDLCRHVWKCPQTPSSADCVPANVPGKVHPNVFGGDRVVQVCCGHSGMMVLTETGRVWVVGGGECVYMHRERERVQQDNHDEDVQQEVAGEYTGRVIENPMHRGEKIFTKPISMVAMGCADMNNSKHYVALDEDGGVWTWGSTRNGECGFADKNEVEFHVNPTSLPVLLDKSLFGNEKVVMISAGSNRTAAVTKSGRLWLWGMHFAPSAENMYRPTMVPTQGMDGKLVRSISCSDSYMLIVTTCGILWTMYDKDHILRENQGASSFLWGDWDPYTTSKETPPLPRPVRGPNESDPTDMRVEKFGGAKILACKAGVRSAAVVTENGELYVWGGLTGSSHPKRVGHGRKAVQLWSHQTDNDYIARDRIMALFQGHQERLGRESHLYNLPPDVLKSICTCHCNRRQKHAVKMMMNGNAL